MPAIRGTVRGRLDACVRSMTGVCPQALGNADLRYHTTATMVPAETSIGCGDGDEDLLRILHHRQTNCRAPRTSSKHVPGTFEGLGYEIALNQSLMHRFA